jgi:spore coat protein A, manganese oxidase
VSPNHGSELFRIPAILMPHGGSMPIGGTEAGSRHVMEDATITRRDALKLGVLATAAAALPVTVAASAKRASELAENRMPRLFARPFVRPPVLQSTGVDPADVDPFELERDVYEITMKEFTADLGTGFATRLWGYNGIFPGPTISARRGRGIRVRFANELPDQHPVFRYEPTTSVHLHGATSRPQFDGYANDTSRPGQFKDYLYDNTSQARTLWYHDHAVHHTAENVAMGLAAQYHLRDSAEDVLRLPTGDYDVPLTVNDIAFTSRGQLLYDDRGDSGPMGDVILVNGVPWPAMPVEPRKYRFRVLNASIARGYRFRLNVSAPLTVIATDGGLTPAPIPTNELRMSMGERYDVIIDFAPFRGRRIELRNAGVDNSIDYDFTNRVMAFDVLDQAPNPENNGPIPDKLAPNNPIMALQPSQAKQTRRLRFERSGSEWVINGETWADVEGSEFEKTLANPGLNDIEIWEFQNNSGGWFHPIHLHLVDFKVLTRNGRAPRPYEGGPKDVVYLGEGETIRVITQFGPREGRYMLHCHNNSHEDHDMMHQFEVGENGTDPLSAPPEGVPRAERLA